MSSTTTPAPAATTPDDATSTRERLLDAAIEVFQRDGYDGARVHDVARAAGLTTGAIYANFRGKGDLLVEALAGRVRAELRRLTDAAERADASEPLDLLRLLGDRLIAPDADDARALLLDAVVASTHDDALAPLVRDAVADRERRLRALVDHAQDAGALDPALDTDALTHYCLMLAMGALVTRALRIPPPDTSAWEALIERMLDGAAPRPDHDHPSRQETNA